MENDLLTNKSAGALLRESELELVKLKIPPVDLRTVPLERWDNYLEHDVTLPEWIQLYFKCRPAAYGKTALDQDEVLGLEATTEIYHGVKPPYHIYMSTTLQQTGRPWKYVPEAGDYLTGLILGKT